MRRLFSIPIILIFFCIPEIRAGDDILPVLVYHHIEDNPKSDVACTPAAFHEQMERLLNAGFTPVNLHTAESFILGCEPNVSKPILITFDDGYESLYHHALPTAKSLKFPMTVFVITSRLGRKPQFLRYLSAEQIQEMHLSGWFDFGSHTHDLHTDIIRIYDGFTILPNPVKMLVKNDLKTSREVLEKILGFPPTAIAWPYGSFNEKLSAAARQSGYTLHFTSRNGYNMPGDNPFSLRRIPVSRRDTADTVLKKARGVRFGN